LEGDVNASAGRVRIAASCTSYVAATERELLARFAETRDEFVEPASRPVYVVPVTPLRREDRRPFLETSTMHCRYVRIPVVVFALAVSAATASAGSYTFTPISAPFGGIFFPAGINNSGVIVGEAQASQVPFIFESFVLSGGVFTPVNFPGTPAGNTGIQSINNLGQYVGGYMDASGAPHGFIFAGGTYQTVDFSSAPPGQTIVYGLNTKGVAVGANNIDAFGDSLSFTFAGGKFTPLSFPGATSTLATSINDAGDIVGGYTDSSGNNHGFLMHKGVFTTIDDPLATGGGLAGTGPATITNSGTIVGTVETSDGSVHGFVYQNGVFTTVDAPGTTDGTQILGGNDLGQLVGIYRDAAGKTSGFVATPTAVPEPASLALLAVTGLALAARRLRKRA
jgi:probable HAF family extracellular repeat protein